MIYYIWEHWNFLADLQNEIAHTVNWLWIGVGDLSACVFGS